MLNKTNTTAPSALYPFCTSRFFQRCKLDGILFPSSHATQEVQHQPSLFNSEPPMSCTLCSMVKPDGFPVCIGTTSFV